MPSLRTLLFWIHLVAGVVAGAVVMIMSVTGVLLTYQKQMTGWADTRGMDGRAPTGTSSPMSRPALIATVAATEQGTPTAVVWRRGSDTPVEVQFGREKRVFVNAYSGAVLGTGSVTMRGFFSLVTDWHRRLSFSGERRDLGKAITGASNLAFLLLVFTGFWLWWPRLWTPTAFRNVGWFRRGLSPKARDFNWHNVVGIWSAIPLLLIVASASVISYRWASDLAYRVVGEAPPARAGAAVANAPAVTAREAGLPRTANTVIPASLDAHFDRAQSQMPAWRTISLTLPKSDTARLVFSLDGGMGGEPQKRAQLTLTAAGEVESYEPFSALSRGRRLRSIMRFLHTGEVLGIPGQTLAGLVSLGAALLVLTGLALSIRRLVGWTKRVRRA